MNINKDDVKEWFTRNFEPPDLVRDFLVPIIGIISLVMLTGIIIDFYDYPFY